MSNSCIDKKKTINSYFLFLTGNMQSLQDFNF